MKFLIIIGLVLIIMGAVALSSPLPNATWVKVPEDVNVLGDGNAALCRGGEGQSWRYCIPVD